MKKKIPKKYKEDLENYKKYLKDYERIGKKLGEIRDKMIKMHTPEQEEEYYDLVFEYQSLNSALAQIEIKIKEIEFRFYISGKDLPKLLENLDKYVYTK